MKVIDITLEFLEILQNSLLECPVKFLLWSSTAGNINSK